MGFSRPLNAANDGRRRGIGVHVKDASMVKGQDVDMVFGTNSPNTAIRDERHASEG